MKWADWKEQVQDSPRTFIVTYLSGAAVGVIVIVLGGLMTASPYGKYPASHQSPVWGVIVLGVGILILATSVALVVMAVGYWSVERRRKRALSVRLT